MSEQVTHVLPLSPSRQLYLHPPTGEVRNKPAVGRESGLPLLAQKRGQQQQQKEILSTEVVLLHGEMRHRRHMSLLDDAALRFLAV